jgi:geranylgeranyl pyrophosphate synthase
MIYMMAEALNNNFLKTERHVKDIKKWAAVIEMMHIASLAHDDIIDDSPSRRGL